MKTFVAVIQINSKQFDIFKFNSTTSTRLFPQTSKVGVCVHIMESTNDNDRYCISLAEKMNLK